MRRRIAQLLRGLPRQDGFSIIEVVISVAIVGMTATGTFFALQTATKTSERNERASVAHEIAVNELERLRRLGDSSLSTLLAQDNTSRNTTIGGVQYTSSIRAYYKSGIGTQFTDACGSIDTSGGAKYVYLRVEVDFAGRQEAGIGPSGPAAVSKPVMDTYFATEGGDLQTASGTLRVYVMNQADTPLSSRTVQLYKMPAGTLQATGTTNQYGCVLFTGLPRSTYEVRVPTSTEVDKYGNTNPVKLTVKMPTRGALTRTINLASPVTVNLAYYTRLTAGNTTKTFVTPGTSPLSSLVGPFVSYNPALTDVTPAGYTFRNTGSNHKFYPFPSGYNLFAGSCVDNNPDDGNSGNGQEQFVIPASGSSGWSAGFNYTPNPELLLPQFRIRVGQGSLSSWANGAKVQVKMNGTACGTYPTGPTDWLKLTGTTDSSGYLANNAYVLPAGSYTVCVRHDRWKYTFWPFGYNEDYYGTASNVNNPFPGPNNYSYATSSTTACGDSGKW
jgi:prepilin-type N-terminal cleavage/methylation domain-containing protein